MSRVAAAPTLSDEQRLAWLRLIRSESVGPRTFRALVGRFGGAAAALDHLPGIARKVGRRVRIPSAAEAESELEALGRLGGRFVAQGEPDYPRPLLAVDTSPPLLALRGSATVLHRPTVAIVGSRNASAAGSIFTERLAAGLGEAGFTVVSGLARGIDARAHKASVASGTAAVLAGGHDRIYPDENRPLLERIVAEGGAALSEMPLGWAPRGRDFPRRNRIVSGLAYGVVVVEAARRSGSLITARFALEQGREVFAVPGSPVDPRAEGTNDLIRSGATLCAAPEHVVSILAPLVGRGMPDQRLCSEPPPRPYDDEALWDEFGLDGVSAAPVAASSSGDEGSRPVTEGERILALIGPAPVAIDELSRLADLPARRVLALLVELELSRLIERPGGGTVALRPLR